MRKKWLSALCAATMLAVNVTPILAEEVETEVETVNVQESESEYEAQINLGDFEVIYEGAWAQFSGGFQLYLPADWNVYEISDEMAEEGVIFEAAADDESGYGMYITCFETGEDYTLEDYQAELVEYEGSSEVGLALINNLPVVTFTYEESDITGMAFINTEGELYSINFYPQSDSDMGQLAMGIISSLRESSFNLSFGDTEIAYEGSWLAFEAGFQLYLPNDWNIYEISEEDAQSGLLFRSGDEETGRNMNVSYMASSDDEVYTLEQIAAEFKADERYANVSLGSINEIRVMTFDSADETATGLGFMDVNGGMYLIACGPADDEDFYAAGITLLTSLSFVQEEVETEAGTAE